VRNNGCFYLGEVDGNSIPMGRGVEIYKSGGIFIKYFSKERQSTGNFAYIHPNGRVDLGNYYKDSNNELQRT